MENSNMENSSIETVELARARLKNGGDLVLMSAPRRRVGDFYSAFCVVEVDRGATYAPMGEIKPGMTYTNDGIVNVIDSFGYNSRGWRGPKSRYARALASAKKLFNKVKRAPGLVHDRFMGALFMPRFQGPLRMDFSYEEHFDDDNDRMVLDGISKKDRILFETTGGWKLVVSCITQSDAYCILYKWKLDTAAIKRQLTDEQKAIIEEKFGDFVRFMRYVRKCYKAEIGEEVLQQVNQLYIQDLRRAASFRRDKYKGLPEDYDDIEDY